MASRAPTRSPGKKLHNDVVESSANAFSGQFRRIFLNLSRLSLSKRHRVFYALNSTGHPVEMVVSPVSVPRKHPVYAWLVNNTSKCWQSVGQCLAMSGPI